MKYIDYYSLINYGHVHFMYMGKHIYNTDEDLFNVNWKKLNVLDCLTNKGKIMKTSIITENPEIFGETYNGAPNELKGQYGDFHLITKIMNYISPFYEIINNDFIAYMIPYLNEENKTLLDFTTNNVSNDLKLLINNDKTDIMENENLKKILLDDKTTHKGKLAEQFIKDYLKKYIPDIKDVSNIPRNMDLYSDELNIRFEIKCHINNEKQSVDINKFNRDCYVNKDNTLLFVYLDLTKDSSLKTHLRAFPLRLFVNGYDFNEDMIDFIINSANNINRYDIIENKTNLTSHLIIKDTRTMFQEMLNDFKKEIEENYVFMERQKNIPLKNNTIEVPDRVEHCSKFVKNFLDDNRILYQKGYYAKKSYELYLSWCKENKVQPLLYKEFNKEMKKYCNNVRILKDIITGVNNRLHYYVLKE